MNGLQVIHYIGWVSISEAPIELAMSRLEMDLENKVRFRVDRLGEPQGYIDWARRSVRVRYEVRRWRPDLTDEQMAEVGRIALAMLNLMQGGTP
jgi:hypothetical protein